jgi:C4-dicarboxylate-specific signal transduction histidine kinase
MRKASHPAPNADDHLLNELLGCAATGGAGFGQIPASHGGFEVHAIEYASERGHERCLLANSSMTFDGREVSLLALMPIESELEAQTLLAWRQLVHVLTHEIMNSLTPIASLSRTAQELLGETGSEKDLALALDTIGRRAESLAGFVANYRHISERPPPQPEPVLVEDLFARLNQMVSADWRARGGGASFMVQPTTVTLMADPGQLEQAMLNLLKNAAQATRDVAQPTLSVSARLLRGGRLALEVRDNGPGVPIGMESDIFLPFVSASQGTDPMPQGRGIGLAVVRNLVHGMGGTVRYVKPLDGGACFVLSW